MSNGVLYGILRCLLTAVCFFLALRNPAVVFRGYRLTLLSYAVNLFSVASWTTQTMQRRCLVSLNNISDPLPQSIGVNAIVIGFCNDVFLRDMAMRARWADLAMITFDGHANQNSTLRCLAKIRRESIINI